MHDAIDAVLRAPKAFERLLLPAAAAAGAAPATALGADAEAASDDDENDDDDDDEGGEEREAADDAAEGEMMSKDARARLNRRQRRAVRAVSRPRSRAISLGRLQRQQILLSRGAASPRARARAGRRPVPRGGGRAPTLARAFLSARGAPRVRDAHKRRKYDERCESALPVARHTLAWRRD